MRRGFLQFVAVAVLPLISVAQNIRKEVRLAEGWRFSLENAQMKADMDELESMFAESHRLEDEIRLQLKSLKFVE